MITEQKNPQCKFPKLVFLIVIHWSIIFFGMTSFPAVQFQYLKHSIKGYLRYKTITSQHVPSKAQIKDFVLFQRKIMFCSQDIQVFVFLTIP